MKGMCFHPRYIIKATQDHPAVAGKLLRCKIKDEERRLMDER